MRPRVKVRRVRCCECWQWFLPNPRSAKKQVTCGRPECRQERHNELARERRAKRPEKYRAGDLVRQRRCRAKRKRQTGTGPPGPEVHLALCVDLRIERVVELALSRPPPTRTDLSAALHELARVCATPSEGGP